MKSFKKLIIPLAIMVALILAVVIWAVFFKDKGDTTEESYNTTVLGLTPYDVKTIRVNKKDEPDLAFESSFSDTEEQVWTYTGEEDASDADLSQVNVTSYVYILCSFTVNSKVQNPGELSEYGLADPEYTIDITTFDGQTHKIIIGDQTYDSSSCYMMIDDDSSVYTVAVIKRVYCGYKLIDFLSTQILNIDYSDIATVGFDRKSDNTHLLAEVDVNPETGVPNYYMIEPFKISGSAYFTNLIEYAATLEISSFIEIEEDSLAEYGLDDPEYTFTFNMESGQTIVINLSADMGGMYYGTCTGVDGYFQLSSMQMKGLDYSVLSLIDSYVCYYNASEISSITGTYGDEEFTLTLDVDNAISDDNAVVNLNMRNCLIKTSTGRSYAAILFESLVCIDIGGIEPDAVPTGDPVLSLKYVTDHYQTINIDFIQRDTDSYYVMMDGEYSSFYVYSRELFKDGGTDTFSYGCWTAYELAQEAIDNAINGIYDIPEETVEET